MQKEHKNINDVISTLYDVENKLISINENIKSIDSIVNKNKNSIDIQKDNIKQISQENLKIKEQLDYIKNKNKYINICKKNKNMCDDFNTIALQCNKERLQEEFKCKYDINCIAKTEYELFSVWCRIYKNSQETEQNFKEYQLKENKKLGFWVKKKIAELFFGYKFTWDYDKNKWVRERQH